MTTVAPNPASSATRFTFFTYMRKNVKRDESSASGRCY
jgi:hypothetical protein